MVAFAMRCIVLLTDGSYTIGPATRSPTNVAVLILCALHIVGTSMGFFAMLHQRQRDELLERARRDGLTGLYTRTAFFESASALSSQPYAVAMIDLDNFKAINDTYGHRGGDLILSHAARTVLSSARITDVVGRYGGEEFCVLLPGADAAVVSKFAHRIVDEARRQAVRLPDGITASYTLSVGYAHSPGTAARPREALDDVLHRADGALYAAKRDGRDRARPALPAQLAAASV
jgi:diguanylate cyclase (GGDEF)-like protein